MEPAVNRIMFSMMQHLPDAADMCGYLLEFASSHEAPASVEPTGWLQQALSSTSFTDRLTNLSTTPPAYAGILLKTENFMYDDDDLYGQLGMNLPPGIRRCPIHTCPSPSPTLKRTAATATA